MNTTKRFLRLFLAAIAMLIMTQTAFATSYSLNNTSVSIVVGKTVALKVTPSAKKVTWKSKNKKVATVTKKGKVKGISAGTTTIEAKIKGGATLRCEVTVKTNKPSTAATTTPAQGGTSSNTNVSTTPTTPSNDDELIISGNAGNAGVLESTPSVQNQIRNQLIAMRADYPEGISFDNSDFYAWNGGIYIGGYGCAAFAMMLSDAVFGDVPAKKHTNFDDIKVGDIVRMDNNTHSVIVLANDGTNLIVAEGNYNKSVHWGRKIPLKEVKATGTNVMTRYQK